MKTFTIRGGLRVAAVLLGIGAAGCASHSQQGTVTAAPSTIPQLGSEMEKNGIMSQSDYVRQNALARAVSQSHTLSETDLTWTLTELTVEKNSVARARAFNILAAIHPVSDAQKSRILPAITPFLSGSDRLDKLGASRVQRKMQVN